MRLPVGRVISVSRFRAGPSRCLRRAVFATALPVVFVTSSGASMAAPVSWMPSADRCRLLERKSDGDPALERRGSGRRPGRGTWPTPDSGMRAAGGGGRLRGERHRGASAERSSPQAVGEARGHCPPADTREYSNQHRSPDIPAPGTDQPEEKVPGFRPSGARRAPPGWPHCRPLRADPTGRARVPVGSGPGTRLGWWSVGEVGAELRCARGGDSR